MEQKGEIVNRVANSGLVTIDLEEYYHAGERVVIDLADLLFQGLVLREKDLRDYVKEQDWSQYEGKNVAISCSADAIVPTWAFMLLTTRLAPYAHRVVYGTLKELNEVLFADVLHDLPLEEYEGARVVVKGCSELEVPISAYVELTALLQPRVRTLMFGEPCSTVPLYKNKG